MRSIFCPLEALGVEKKWAKKKQGGKWRETGAKGRIPISREINEMEAEGGRGGDLEEEGRKKGEKGTRDSAAEEA